MNADGSNNTILPLDFYPVKPIWTDDGKTVYFLKVNGNLGGMIDYAGSVSSWQEGEAIHNCSLGDLSYVSAFTEAPDHNQLIVTNDNQTIVLADVDKCQESETILELSSRVLYGTFSISQDEQWIAYAIHGSTVDQDSVEIKDFESQTTISIIPAINPAISPDSQWVTDTKLDGIYINKIDGSQETRLVDYNSKDNALSQFEPAPPRPRWSPDGQWLIYHKCITYPGACNFSNDYSIFKVNVLTGEEVKIVDGGSYPYWRDRQSGK